MAWKIAAALLLLQILVKGDDAFDALPSSVVVHGRRGSVWAYARSMAPSPLLIDVPWEVWDGQQVVQDPHLRVSDLSLVPQVLELSFGPGSPSELHQVAGSQLPQGSVRLRPMDGAPAPWMAPHPQHLVIEGVVAGEGAANGVYRLATELLNQQPVYHKTDAVRSASLWFAAGDWRFGPSIEDGTVWAYATSDVLSGDANWRSFDGQAQDRVHIRDARMAIPEKLTISGTEFLQEKRLCDARPVFGATLGSNDTGHGGHSPNGSPATSRVFLYFRAHQSEWWLGPEVGGTEFVARATGSLFQVIPRIEELRWRVQVQAEPDNWKSDNEAGETDLDLETVKTVTVPSWSRLLCSFALAISGILLWSFRGSLGGGKKGRGLNPSKSETELACVVCLEAPRQILLMPCRHVCCCKDCAERLERCPICRTETKSLAEAVYHLLCRSFVEPAWGATQVDLTEFFLAT
eukprot:s1416_g16.t5